MRLEWMSYSRLREMEECPRRWSLSSASYPEIWSRRGYPSKIYFSALAGQIIHAALEMITIALNRAGCVSVRDDSFVSVMRELGGYTKIVEATVENTCADLKDNPRFTSKSDYISKKIRNLVPSAARTSANLNWEIAATRRICGYTGERFAEQSQRHSLRFR
jgi:hypothetical protein